MTCVEVVHMILPIIQEHRRTDPFEDNAEKIKRFNEIERIILKWKQLGMEEMLKECKCVLTAYQHEHWTGCPFK